MFILTKVLKKLALCLSLKKNPNLRSLVEIYCEIQMRIFQVLLLGYFHRGCLDKLRHTYLTLVQWIQILILCSEHGTSQNGVVFNDILV